MKHKINSTNTKQMLVDALIHLATKKPISKITVSELVTYCDINRKTFYYHFTDIYDLLEWHLNDEINKAISKFDPINDINSTIAYSIEYMNQHSYLKNFIEDSLARDKISKILNKTIYPIMVECIESYEHSDTKKLDPDFKEFLSKNLTQVIILSSFDSIENSNPYDIESLQKHISKLIQITTQGLSNE